MINQEFHEMLIKLHNELKNTLSVDKKDRELLHTLMKDIQHVLELNDEKNIYENRSLVEQLTESIYHLEESHPTLVLTMKKVIETLSNMGI